MDIASIIGILSMMALSAFFSGMEIAFVSSNRLLAEMDKEKNAVSQKIISFFYRQPNGFVSTMLVGNNIVLVIYGILFARIFDNTVFSPFEPGVRVTLDTILSTLIILFTGEFLPKTIFKSSPNTLLSLFAPLAAMFYVVLWPISKLATFLSRMLLRIVGVKIDKEESEKSFTKVDLDYLVQTSIDNTPDGDDVDEEVRIFQNALDFHDTKVRDCMIPRTEINAVDMDDCTADELMQKFIESGNSKIVVFKGDIDHVVGYIHSQEMFRKPANWQESIRKMPFVPETMAAQKLMRIFLQQKKSLGIVVDEFGGTSGLVSLEDIVEEITGDIQDEHDNSNLVCKKVGENEFIISGRMEIDSVNDKLDIELPESDDYMTVSGLILHEYQSIPKLNEMIAVGKYNFKILKSTATKIELIKLIVGK